MDNSGGGGEGARALQTVSQEETILGIRTYKVFWSIFFGIVFIIIFLAVYLIFTSGHKNVSDKKLMEGVAMEVGENDVVNFELDKEEHGMWINFVGDDSVELTISSTPINVSLKINEIKEIDLNNDGSFDLKIKLISIIDGKAIIAFQKVEAESCKEKWECSVWFDCSRGYQKRECKDLNSCGSIFDKPSEKKECLEMEFVENNSAFEEETNNNQSVNERIANSLNTSLSNTDTLGINITTNKSVNTSVENKVNTTANHTSSTNSTDRPASNNWTNYTQVEHPANTTTTANTTGGSSGSAENHSTTNTTSSTTGTSPCPTGTYFCNEYYGYICKTDFITNPNSPFCCSNQCLKIPSSEYLCYARGYKFFTGNETHICKVQVYTHFNATSVACCSVIEARYTINTNTTGSTGSGGTSGGANTNTTNSSGLTNQI